MAHSDALIFLTNITWIFFLFLFLYFFFALFFLPTFYKKFRTRVLAKRVYYFKSLSLIQQALAFFAFSAEMFQHLNEAVVHFLKGCMAFLRPLNLTCGLVAKTVPSIIGDNSMSGFLSALNGYYLNLVATDTEYQSVCAGVTFTKYSKLQ